MRNKWFGGAGCLCFYCGVDSGPLIVLFLFTLGLTVVGAVLLFAWSVARGHWADSEKPKYKVLEVESDERD